MNVPTHNNWSVADSAALYGIEHWGGGNFSVSANGEVTITVPFSTGEVAVPLTAVIQEARNRGHALPLLLRIENMLDARISMINETFRQAIRNAGYTGTYNGVFPVKVNQQCAVIEEISRFSTAYGHGLEAGSKAELLLCLANLNENSLLICKR
ncbi:MAG: hypothetical protein U9R21_04850 [Candidatus Thermoplasmatota archaeon]|nr:hypothetical protein [Candidatus Thermoplasmatota archaeon]